MKHPAPWTYRSDGRYWYVEDANDQRVFGFYTERPAKLIVALVNEHEAWAKARGRGKVPTSETLLHLRRWQEAQAIMEEE